MALVLTGIVRGMRVVGNKADEEHAAGAKWRFLSLEISDARSGVHSCQISDRSPQYKELVGSKNELLKDYTDHKVKAIIQAVQPGMRDVTDDEGNVLKSEPIVRIRVARLEDLGVPGDDE
ncbi:hypothetical protein KSF_030870 [Reticulibacter mediterranei]|uniref:Uncharacterized protein n=1 Tax=Reticulibacter mediterranei TaxID=2778369 RepID=A0A8J3MZF1_9CHLR|nr:hypothetical protein [Reticulibacter mediterranei]GHO93039.1 hypothetical protein KSF_030870 [Reticulibacter mediterranei]